VLQCQQEKQVFFGVHMVNEKNSRRRDPGDHARSWSD